jgi:hypothetical protein
MGDEPMVNPTLGSESVGPAHKASRIAWTLLALLLLNGLLSFSTWWPTPGILPDARLAPEFVLYWLLILVLVAWRRSLNNAMLGLLSVGYLLLVLGRYVDVTAPALFGRAVNLYWDVPQIPRFLWVTAQDHSAWVSVLVVLAVVALLAALYQLLRWATLQVAREAAPFALRSRLTLGASLAATALVGANYAGVQSTWPYVSKPVVPTYAKQASLLVDAFSPNAMGQLLPATTVVEAAMADAGALGALRGRDVYLVFLESYGAVTYDNASAAKRFQSGRAAIEAAAAGQGQQVLSAFVRSPTIGGASDLAHLSLLAGVDLSDPRRHDLLLTTEKPTLLTLFEQRGYQTFGLYPAVSWEWPERAYYGFDVYLEGRNLDYQGPALGFWKIPDQFAMAQLEKLHPRSPTAAPRLVFVATITCHFPFSPVPPYQPDWTRVLTPDPFDAPEVQRALAEKPNWLDMAPDYLRMVDYTLTWVAGFLKQPEPREAVYIFLGDHQPTTNISGNGVPWDVPMHIVTRDRALAERLAESGFAPGMNPPRAPLGGMHDLTRVLLKVLSDPRSLASANPPTALR